jgi:hypothetical protein
MAHTVDGLKLDEETYKLVKKLAEQGRRKGRADPEHVTIAEMCSDLVHTGAFRRVAANKWAKAHPKKATGKKTARKPAKKAKAKKAAPRKAVKKAAPKAQKPRAAKKERTPKLAPVPTPEAAAPAPAAAANDLLS